MKNLIMFFIAFLFVSGIQAQTLKVPAKTDATKAQESLKTETNNATGQANMGSLIGQLTNNISDNAFTDAFRNNKAGFINSLSSVKDIAGASSALQKLQGGLLPAAKDAGWSKVKDKWLKDTKAANSIKSVASSASLLESNISDKFFKGNWASVKPAWEAGLKTLSK